MGLFSKFRNWMSGNRSMFAFMAGTTKSKIDVTTAVALQTSVMLCCARVIAESVSQCPLKLMIETDDEKSGHKVRKPARDHELYDILAYNPCWMTSYELIETLLIHAAIEGNGYCYLNRGASGKGKVKEILPLLPEDVQVDFDRINFQPQYKINLGGIWTNVARNQILHLRGPGWGGVIGESVRYLAKEAIGLYKNLESANAELQSKDGRPSGVLSTDQELAPEAAERIRQRWMERFGPNGEGGVAVLDAGASFQTITMSAVDAQVIENRKFQVEEICRSMMVFPIMAMQSDKASTFGSTEAFLRAHVRHTVLPWVRRLEETLKRDVVGYEDKTLWPRIQVQALMRGAPGERMEYYTGGRNIGVFSRNDIRAWEDLNPLPDGDDYLRPMNMENASEPGGNGEEDSSN